MKKFALPVAAAAALTFGACAPDQTPSPSASPVASASASQPIGDLYVIDQFATDVMVPLGTSISFDLNDPANWSVEQDVEGVLDFTDPQAALLANAVGVGTVHVTFTSLSDSGKTIVFTITVIS